MAEFFDGDGNPVEALTEEEVNAKIEEAVDKAKEEAIEEVTEEHKEELDDLKTTVDDLTKQIEEKDKELSEEGKTGTKSYNFRKLEKDRDEMKAKKEEAEKKLADIRQEVDDKIKGVKQEIGNKKIDDAIQAMTGANKELFDKMKSHFLRLTPAEVKKPEEKEEDFRQRINDAFVLATGHKPENPLTGPVISSAGGNVPPQPTPGGGGKLSEDGKAVAGKMGITEEELKKRGHI